MADTGADEPQPWCRINLFDVVFEGDTPNGSAFSRHACYGKHGFFGIWEIGPAAWLLWCPSQARFPAQKALRSEAEDASFDGLVATNIENPSGRLVAGFRCL